jgi:hypothetical protein
MGNWGLLQTPLGVYEGSTLTAPIDFSQTSQRKTTSALSLPYRDFI